MTVKRIPALDTKLQLIENSEVSLVEVSVSRICDSTTGAALGKSAFGGGGGGPLAPGVNLRMTEAHLEEILRKTGVG